MAEPTTWTEESPSEAPKKKIATWIWFCGAGCLAMLVLGIVLAIFAVGFVKNATDPDKQWEGIAKILPYDKRPADMTPLFGMDVGVEQYTLHDDRGYEIQLQHFTGTRAKEAREQIFEHDPPEIPKDMFVLKLEETKPARVEVQGRELHVLRLKGSFPGLMKKIVPKEGRDQLGSMLWADVTPEDRGDLVFWQMHRSAGRSEGAEGQNIDKGPITDDELRTVLEPFHVGPKR